MAITMVAQHGWRDEWFISGTRRGPGLRRLAAAALALIPAAASAAPVPSDGAGVTGSRSFLFRYQAVVKEVPETAREAFLWIPYPPEDGQQEIRGLEILSSLPHEIVTEPRYGNRALRFTLRPGIPVQEAALEVHVVRRERVNRPAGRVDPPPTPPADLALWLGPDRRVPIDGKVAEWARETTSGRTTDLERARAIYDYVVTTLKYDKTGTGWGNGDIFWACDAKRGNCTDFHAIFIGFSRAMGIPARFEIGFPIPAERGRGEIAGYHCWAQFYLEGQGWIPVDASEANKNPAKREYFFGAHDENRILFSVGRDLLFTGMRGEPLNFFIYPYAEVDGAKHDAVERRFFYRDIDSPGTPPAHSALD